MRSEGLCDCMRPAHSLEQIRFSRPACLIDPVVIPRRAPLTTKKCEALALRRQLKKKKKKGEGGGEKKKRNELFPRNI